MQEENRNEQAEKKNTHLIQPPSIKLLKGGGAIRGIDEKFQVNPATGSGSMTIPVAVSPGRSGFGPQLTLSYDSSSGNGRFGLGWNLSLPEITRKTDKGLPRYIDGDESDTFILSGAEDLVPELEEVGGNWELVSVIREMDGVSYRVARYRPRIEGLFSRIESWTNQNSGESHWRSISRDNMTTLYGRTPNSRIADPSDPWRIFSWLICESYDDKGNAIYFEYKEEDSIGIQPSLVHERNRSEASRSSNRYPKRIRYGNRTPRQPNEDLGQRDDWLFTALFDYGEGHLIELPPDGENRQLVEASLAETQPWPVRQDPFSTYRAGFEVRTYRLCQRVMMFHHFPDELGVEDYLVRSTEFRHEPNPILTYLVGATHAGYVLQPDGSYWQKMLPLLEFEYSQVPLQDGLQPEDAEFLQLREIDSESLENLPVGIGSGYPFVDLDGEGLSGILTEQANHWYYKQNLGNGRFGPLQPVATRPSLANLNGGHQLLDLAGDGQLDLVMLSGPSPGFYERTQRESWTDFKPFPHLPNLDWNDPNLRFVDLTGDGHADVLITENNVFIWYPSLAEAGYGPATAVHQAFDEEQGPRLVFSDGTQSIFLTDLSGDGLVDLARIGNGEVCYWPNLGYGRFGAKVTMDNAPWFDSPDIFDHSRLRLADIDGSGIADIIYLGVDGVNIYFNQAGNSWSDGQTLTQFPTYNNQAAVQVTDLLGNGTACLIWSSPLPGDVYQPLRYVDLMNGIKPHLMVGARNNLGAETRLQYAPSTQFYLADKAAGRPWMTRLPFPVHVVERVETFDHISRNRFVSRYAYHHGYFDGVEREFRGFGMVEQWDTEAFATLTEDGHFPSGDNIEAASHVPPVHTKSWFHTGVYMGRDHISNFFAGLLDEEDLGEYFRESGLTDEAFAAHLLPDTVLPDIVLPNGLTAAEEREACRALKGALLRQEVYALDDSEQSQLPFVVKESNMTVHLLQPKDSNKHAVFFTHVRESLNYHYERNPADPRLSHSCVLEVDIFGNVLRSVAIGYGRRTVDNTLSLEDQARQSQILATLSENEYTNAIDEDDVYRTPAQWSARTFELTGLPDLDSGERYSFAQLREAAEEAASIDYEESPTEGGIRKRLLEELITRFRADDMTGLLSHGIQESLALPGESYQLAFSQNHIDLIFEDKVTEAMLANDGRYVHLDGSTDWYIPSGRIFLSPSLADTPAQELAFAQDNFFLPWRFRDPFQETTTVTYDEYKLLITETRDPIGNEVSVVNSYRFLQPLQITDPNGNRTAVSFDALGLVAGTAVMGTPADAVGDSLDNFQPDLTDSQIAAFLADPKGPIAADLLMDATTRIIYDVDRFQTDEEPSVAVTLARETHVSEPLPPDGLKIQVSLGYSDGLGREVQKKVQAETKIVEINGVETEVAWVGSGWTIFNNKGQPVRQYEPFFRDTHHFEFAVTVGVSPILFYDPLERVVATLHPNHTFEKVVFDPWQQTSWDVNDTVLIADPATDPDVGSYFSRLESDDYLPTWHARRSGGALGAAEQDAAQKTAAHADTPTRAYFDSLGRPFLAIADNSPFGQYPTRTLQDIEGIILRVIDARGNAVMVYERETPANSPNFTIGSDVAGRQLYQNGMDGGERWLLPDVTGKPIYQWDSRDHRFRFAYDALQRPTHRFVRRGQTPEMLYERLVYGEAHPEALGLKLRGQLHLLYDGAGVVTNAAYDFKGNLRRSTRRLAREYRLAVDWPVLANATDISVIEAAAEPFLESEQFSTEATFDALNRPLSQLAPDQSLTLIGYNDANLLETVTVHLQGAAVATPFVTNIDYDAKGQRERIVYGNGATTTYTYDAETFRLTNLLTGRGAAFPDDCPNPPDPPCGIQNLHYTYDPVGNITSIRDEAQQTVFFANQVVQAHTAYTYDPIYQLIAARGREHRGQNADTQRDHSDFPAMPLPHPNAPNALRNYTEQYDYDPVGNILRMRHVADGANWTQRYEYATDSNRLLSTSAPGDAPLGPYANGYSYNAHGSMASMPHLHLMAWDFKEQLQATATQQVNSGTPETTYYVYDAAGQRVRKVTERFAPDGQTPTRRKERIYWGGFEVYREYDSDGATVSLERQTLPVMDDQQRIALIETRTQGNDGSPGQLIRYQLGNHLGSVALELDEASALISYEEYHPYGTTAYHACRSEVECSLKRYRYTGKERDEETGFYYHGARYYACWLGRWGSCDPSGLKDGLNLYQYVSSNPIIFWDSNGKEKTLWEVIVESLAHEREIKMGVVQGWFDSAKELAVGLVENSMPGADERRARFLAKKYKEGEKDDGVTGGITAILNEFNPVYHAGKAFIEAYWAAEKGEWVEAGRHIGKGEVHSVEAVLTAVSGAGMVTRSAGVITRAVRGAGTLGTGLLKDLGIVAKKGFKGLSEVTRRLSRRRQKGNVTVSAEARKLASKSKAEAKKLKALLKTSDALSERGFSVIVKQGDEGVADLSIKRVGDTGDFLDVESKRLDKGTQSALRTALKEATKQEMPISVIDVTGVVMDKSLINRTVKGFMNQSVPERAAKGKKGAHGTVLILHGQNQIQEFSF